jgi:undecaprenyl-diphosphatase
VDWRIYHSVNRFVEHHSWLGRLFAHIETYGTVVIAVAAIALWFFARPGGDRKWKFASASALGAAALGLVANRIVAAIHHRDRPFIAHPSAHLWGPHKTDPSLPSDHATAALAIAVAVLLIDTGVGVVFLALAVLIALAAAFIVVRIGRPVIAYLVRILERVTDPLLARVWRPRTTER